jgi:hypothetical protein
MRRLTLALALVALALPSATATADQTTPEKAPTTQGCHHGASAANIGIDV